MLHRACELVLTDLDTGDLVVMPDSKLAKSQLSERGFSLFNLSELLRGHLRAIGNSGGKAGIGRAVPVGKAELFCPFADLFLPYPGFLKRAADPVLSCGPETRAMVSKIISVCTIKDPGEAFSLREVDQALIDISLEKIAARRVVALVAGVFCFAALDHLVGDPNLGGNTPGGF